MPLSERLRSFLLSNQARFIVSNHPKAFKARDVAVAEHLPAREVAKTVVIFGDGAYKMMVVPASRLVDLHEVRTALGLAQARLATEDELGKLFPDCELGAMPPLGPMYGMPVYLDAALAGQPVVAFNAGTHSEVIHMQTSEFRRLASPRIVSLAREPEPSYNW